MIVDAHLDVDLLVENIEEVVLILNARKKYPFTNRVAYEVLINGNIVDFDLRYVGDNYMEQKWQKNILNNRFLFNKLYYRPSNEDYLYSLIYHSLIHKEEISSDYMERFEYLFGKNNHIVDKIDRKLLIDMLSKYLLRNDYDIVEPHDMSVTYNNKDFKHQYVVEKIN